MAFAQPIPRPFNEQGIWFYAPAVSGVFGISNSRGWIFVGEAPDIRAALIGYVRKRDSQFLDSAPTGFVFEQCPSEVRKVRRTQLAAEYRPRYSPKLGSGAGK